MATQKKLGFESFLVSINSVFSEFPYSEVKANFGSNQPNSIELIRFSISKLFEFFDYYRTDQLDKIHHLHHLNAS